MEGIVEHYLSLLDKEPNAGVLLTKFFCENFSVPFAASMIPQLNKLVKLYGRVVVFNAILEISDKDIDMARVYGLLAHICKRSVTKPEGSNYSSLYPYISSREERLKKAVHFVDVKSPFED